MSSYLEHPERGSQSVGKVSSCHQRPHRCNIIKSHRTATESTVMCLISSNPSKIIIRREVACVSRRTRPQRAAVCHAVQDHRERLPRGFTSFREQQPNDNLVPKTARKWWEKFVLVSNQKVASLSKSVPFAEFTRARGPCEIPSLVLALVCPMCVAQALLALWASHGTVGFPPAQDTRETNHATKFTMHAQSSKLNEF